jgi:hypothetical protein
MFAHLPKINNCIQEQTREPLQRSVIEGVVVHRIGKELGLTGHEVARSFADTSTKFSAGSYTGGRVPYTFLVRPDGQVDQMLALYDVGPHALRWSTRSIGLACSGDFRKHKPTAEQWLAASQMATAIRMWIGPTCWVEGHTDLPDATKDKTKECPGRLWDMRAFRGEVHQAAEQDSEALMSVMTRAQLSWEIEKLIKLHGIIL